MTRAPVFLTGATGFLGGELARQLCAQGREVHALARASADRSPLAELELSWHTGDLGDAASLEAALGALAGREPDLIHSGAVISYREGDGPLQERVNVEGTRMLLDAAARHGVGRVVYVSSVVGVGCARSAAHEVDEGAEWNGAGLGDYARTKRAGEELALARTELDLMVVNPGAIFGPRSPRSNTTTFVEGVHSRRFGSFAPPGSLSVVGVEDVARGVLLALERGERGRRYMLSDENLSYRELMQRVARAVGAVGPSRVLSPFLWRALVLAVGAWNRVRAGEEVTPQALHLLGCHFRCDTRRARQELGWRTRPFDEVLADTVAWMRAEGRLPG